jgi:hypothetical protein
MAQVFLLSVDDDLPEYDEYKHFAVTALRASANFDSADHIRPVVPGLYASLQTGTRRMGKLVR